MRKALLTYRRPRHIIAVSHESGVVDQCLFVGKVNLAFAGRHLVISGRRLRGLQELNRWRAAYGRGEPALRLPEDAYRNMEVTDPRRLGFGYLSLYRFVYLTVLKFRLTTYGRLDVEIHELRDFYSDGGTVGFKILNADGSFLGEMCGWCSPSEGVSIANALMACKRQPDRLSRA